MKGRKLHPKKEKSAVKKKTRNGDAAKRSACYVLFAEIMRMYSTFLLSENSHKKQTTICL
jgi:hypothetical protein